MTRGAVAIPARGRAAWCEEAARSALAQQGVDGEVVVALDGDDADTRARLASTRDARLRVVGGMDDRVVQDELGGRNRYLSAARERC